MEGKEGKDEIKTETSDQRFWPSDQPKATSGERTSDMCKEVMTSAKVPPLGKGPSE